MSHSETGKQGFLSRMWGWLVRQKNLGEIYIFPKSEEDPSNPIDPIRFANEDNRRRILTSVVFLAIGTIVVMGLVYKGILNLGVFDGLSESYIAVILLAVIAGIAFMANRAFHYAFETGRPGASPLYGMMFAVMFLCGSMFVAGTNDAALENMEVRVGELAALLSREDTNPAPYAATRQRLEQKRDALRAQRPVLETERDATIRAAQAQLAANQAAHLRDQLGETATILDQAAAGQQAGLSANQAYLTACRAAQAYPTLVAQAMVVLTDNERNSGRYTGVVGDGPVTQFVLAEVNKYASVTALEYSIAPQLTQENASAVISECDAIIASSQTLQQQVTQSLDTIKVRIAARFHQFLDNDTVRIRAAITRPQPDLSVLTGNGVVAQLEVQAAIDFATAASAQTSAQAELAAQEQTRALAALDAQVVSITQALAWLEGQQTSYTGKIAELRVILIDLQTKSYRAFEAIDRSNDGRLAFEQLYGQVVADRQAMQSLTSNQDLNQELVTIWAGYGIAPAQWSQALDPFETWYRRPEKFAWSAIFYGMLDIGIFGYLFYVNVSSGMLYYRIAKKQPIDRDSMPKRQWRALLPRFAGAHKGAA